jgi:hypothetical protein
VYVRDGESGAPVAGALVTAEATGMMAATDTAGRTPEFTAPTGSRASARRSGYLPAAVALTRPGRDTGAVEWARELARRSRSVALHGLDLYAAVPRVVRGLVTVGGRQAARGATVEVVSPPGDGPVAQTGADGTFDFNDFPPGRRQVEARFEGCVPAGVEVFARAGETTWVELALRDTTDEGAVEGAVLVADGRRPVPAAVVRIVGGGLETTTDGEGRYRLDRVPSGDQRLMVFADAFLPDTIPFRVLKDWTVTVDVYLRR